MSIRALAFDVFGTVVDWRSSVTAELERFGARHGLERDWPAFADAWRAATGAARAAKSQQLGQRKDAMDSKVADLQDQLEKLANQARAGDRNAARKLDEAAGSITDKRIREMIQNVE